MPRRFRDWWLAHVPWPMCTGWWSPWCWIDDACHARWPMTFGFSNDTVEHWPESKPWICRMHDRAADRYWAKRYPGEE